MCFSSYDSFRVVEKCAISGGATHIECDQVLIRRIVGNQMRHTSNATGRSRHQEIHWELSCDVYGSKIAVRFQDS